LTGSGFFGLKRGVHQIHDVFPRQTSRQYRYLQIARSVRINGKVRQESLPRSDDWMFFKPAANLIGL